MQASDQSTTRVEGLLRDAAEWEPETACPAGLAARALAGLEEPAPGSRRVTTGFLTALLGGGAASTALAGGILALGLPAPEPGAALTPLPKTPVRADLVAAARPTPAQSEVERPPVLPVRRAAGRRPRPAVARLTATKAVPSVELWQTEEVEREEARVIAPALLLQPDALSGELLVRTGIIELPAAAVACRPPDGFEEPSPAEAPVAAPAPTAPEENE